MRLNQCFSRHDIGRDGANSATRFRIQCFNSNSIGKNPKRCKVFHHLKKKNPDIIIACYTRICKSIENVVREEWGGQCIFNSFSSQARGIAIFLKKNNPAKILDKFCDQDGNILAILMLYNDKKILLEGIYGPNDDSPSFYSEKTFTKIVNWFFQNNTQLLRGRSKIAKQYFIGLLCFSGHYEHIIIFL